MNINDPMPAFRLKGTDNQFHSPDEDGNASGWVILFTCNHCPYARAYVQRIANLVDQYRDKGISFWAINPNDPVKYPEDSFENMIPMAEKLHLPGRYLFDETQEVARQFNAQRTPEVFVFDRNKKLIYHGAIDDNYENPHAVKRHYLKDALDSLLEGKAPQTKETPPVGCSVKWK